MRSRHRVQESGESLVSVMVGAAILGIVMMAFTSMQTVQQRETRALTEKFASLSLKSLLTASLADGTVCAYVLNNPTAQTVDLSSAAAVASASVTVPTLYVSVSGATAGPSVATQNSQASPDSNTLWINSNTSSPPGIQLTNFQGSGTSYTANWMINFDKTKTVRPLKPITIPVTLTVSGSTSSATITGCMSGVGGGGVTAGACPSNQIMIGINADGSPECTTAGSQAGAPCTLGPYRGLTLLYPGGRCCAISVADTGSHPPVRCYAF